MKCELCGGKWIPSGNLGKVIHIDNSCKLSGVETYVPVIRAINMALKNDTRKPEECKFHKFHIIERRPYCLIIDPLEPVIGFDTKQIMCPCAAWERKA